LERSLSQRMSAFRPFCSYVGDDPVALLAEEETGPLILEVRPNERRKGYGRGLAEHMIKSWYDRGESVLDIECAPGSSFGFWRRLGFQRIGEGTDEWARQAYLIFKRHHDLGSGPRVPYEISFYPRGLNRETAPFRVYRGHGERMENGSIKLPERAVLYYPFAMDQRGRMVDCVVRVRVGDHDVFEDKVKRES
jgi:GNAT superfamily N-acetyltransferase